jgi:hypothetical protein
MYQRDEPAFRVTEAMPALLTFWSAIVKCGRKMEEKGQGSRLPRSKLQGLVDDRLVLGNFKVGMSISEVEMRGDTPSCIRASAGSASSHFG